MTLSSARGEIPVAAPAAASQAVRRAEGRGSGRDVGRDCRRAFTLIEIVVTLVIVGILAVISMFAFRAFIAAGQDSEAAERLRSVASRQARFAADNGTYTAWPSDLRATAGGSALTPVVSGSSTASTSQELISSAVGVRGSLGLAIRSASGKCLYMVAEPLVVGGAPKTVTTVNASLPCEGRNALAAGALGETPVAETAPVLPPG